MKISILRASVQTLSIIDAAITSLLLVATLLIGVLIPVITSPPSSSMLIPVNGTIKESIGNNGNCNYPHNQTDVYWWYYVNFQVYQKGIRQLGNVLDTSFCLILFVIVVSDVVLVKGVDLSTEVTSTPKSIYYWLMCNMFVIGVLPVLATLSLRVANANGTLQSCGLGCGMPYFYITYRLIYGLMVVLYWCKLRARLAKDPSGISVYKHLYV